MDGHSGKVPISSCQQGMPSICYKDANYLRTKLLAIDEQMPVIYQQGYQKSATMYTSVLLTGMPVIFEQDWQFAKRVAGNLLAGMSVIEQQNCLRLERMDAVLCWQGCQLYASRDAIHLSASGNANYVSALMPDMSKRIYNLFASRNESIYKQACVQSATRYARQYLRAGMTAIC